MLGQPTLIGPKILSNALIKLTSPNEHSMHNLLFHSIPIIINKMERKLEKKNVTMRPGMGKRTIMIFCLTAETISFYFQTILNRNA